MTSLDFSEPGGVSFHAKVYDSFESDRKKGPHF